MVRMELQKTNKWPEKGSWDKALLTRIESPLMLLRMSVLPNANQARTPVGIMPGAPEHAKAWTRMPG